MQKAFQNHQKNLKLLKKALNIKYVPTLFL